MQKVLRFVFRWVDEDAPDFQYNKRKNWLEEKKDAKVIPNSNGENWF